MRDKRIDIIKGFAIFLVVVGHNIQYMKGDLYASGAFFNNELFSVIYSFHMPLFILISGYLFYGSVKKYSIKKLIGNKFISLIIPIIFWAFLLYATNIFVQGASFNFKEFIGYFLSSLWFLWAVFYCSIGVTIGNKYFKDKIYFHLFVMVVLMLTPAILNKDLYAFMYPYFIFGYYAKKFKLDLEKIRSIYLVVPYFLLMLLWDKDKYIYTTGIKLINEANITEALLIDFYRWGVGMLGSLIFIKIVSIIYEKTEIKFLLLQYLGRTSMPIYILNVSVVNKVLSKITIFNQWSDFNYTLVVIISSTIVIGISLLLINIIKPE